MPAFASSRGNTASHMRPGEERFLLQQLGHNLDIIEPWPRKRGSDAQNAAMGLCSRPVNAPRVGKGGDTAGHSGINDL